MDELIDSIVSKLRSIINVEAVVLGGSRASGTHRPDSDIDLGIYYSSTTPLNIEDIRKIAEEVNDIPNPVITNIGEWGRWVNGGAWLTIKGQRVDFLYRDLDFVTKIINECLEGKKEADYYQQPPYGFYSYIYCAEINICKIFYDPKGIITNLKDQVKIYPQVLKENIVNGELWSAEFTLEHAKKYVQRGEIYLFAGCLTRIISSLVQVLYALNEEYFINDKRIYKDVVKFNKKPENFIDKINSILSKTGLTKEELNNTLEKIVNLFNEMVLITEGTYKPKFILSRKG